MNTLSEANGTFAIHLLKILCQNNPSKNVCFSPVSISSALAMVLLGAKGDTAVQISQTLGLNTDEDIHQNFQWLLHILNKPNRKYLLKMTNRLFAENTCEFLPTFKESCLQFYHSELEQLSFAKDPEESRKHINKWVSKQTEGKILELLSRDSLNSETRLVLVNALYFKGRWRRQFNLISTREMRFKINQREEETVQMMCQKDTFNHAYVDEVQAQVLEMPYQGKELSLVILLPDDGVDLSKVENSLTFEKLTAWTNPGIMKSTKVFVSLPKFKLQDDYDMKSVFQHLGMVDVFQGGKADLSGMSPETDLCVSKFVHKSVVEVIGDGMAAPTSFNVIRPVLRPEDIASVFCADHPFLFFIRHKKTNSLLFCGRFAYPVRPEKAAVSLQALSRVGQAAQLNQRDFQAAKAALRGHEGAK
ncbi:serpin B9-like [Microtus pennsylvanicus]|uniref:serpin B9-like n=1 Tax=Microtus pennsylvanicus TaxID=10058 RepID=UPI003F6CA3A8